MTLAEARLEDWVSEFGSIYEKQLGRESVSETWLTFVQQAGEFAEHLRLRDYAECLGKIAKCFCWLSCFVRKCQLEPSSSGFALSRSFSEIVLNKYPWRCPRCGLLPCACYSPISASDPESHMRSSSDSIGGRVSMEQRISTFEQLVQMFDGIYGSAHESLSLEHLGFHLSEEVGEVANAIRILSSGIQSNGERARLGLERELADVLSWLCMLFLKLKRSVAL